MSRGNCGYRACFVGALTLIFIACSGAASADSGAQYADAVDFYQKRQLKDAEDVCADLVKDPANTKGAQEQLNAQVLNLLGEIEKAKISPDYLRAETCHAWAMFEDPEELNYWRNYVVARMKRQGYSSFWRTLSEKERAYYEHSGAFKSRSTTGKSILVVPFERKVGIGTSRSVLAALVCLEMGDIKGAHEYAQRAISPWNSSCIALQTGAMVALASDNVDKARLLSAKAVELCGNSYSANYLAGRAIWLSDRNYEEAKRLLIKAEALDEYQDGATMARLQIDMEMAPGPSEKMRILEQAIAARPGPWEPWCLLWELKFTLGPGQVDDYKAFAGQQQTEKPAYAAPFAAEALALLSNGELGPAEEKLEHALSLHESMPDYRLGVLLVELLQRDTPGVLRALDGLSFYTPRLYEKLVVNGPFPTSLDTVEALSPEMTIRFVNAVLDEYPEVVFSGVSFCAQAIVLIDNKAGRTEIMKWALWRIAQQERELKAQGEDIAMLKDVLAIIEERVDINEERLKDLEEAGRVTEKELQALKDWKISLERRLLENERELAEKLEQQEEKILKVIDQIAFQVSKNRQSLLELGMTRQELRALSGVVNQIALEVEKQGMTQRELMALTKSAAHVRARSVVKLSSLISVGPSIGPFQINLMGLVDLLVGFLND